MKVLVIFGPTATGKTDLALKIAKKINGEIISADSRQVYRELDIGTGKLSKNLTEGHIVKKYKNYWVVDGIKIYGFDLVDPEENFSAADFINFTQNKIKLIYNSHKIPIIAGGTGFYIKSLINRPQTFKIKSDDQLRLKLQNYSKIELFNKLEKIDSQKANSLNNSDKNNPRRLVRAIEIALSKNKKAIKTKPDNQYLILGLTAKNDFLYNKVDDWLDFRLKNGLLSEVNVLKKKVSSKWLISLGLEYRWVTRLLNKEISDSVAVSRLKGDIHKLVRNQKNWFHQFPKIKLFDINEPNWRDKLEKAVTLWYTLSNEKRQFTRKS